jgi:hypothetical protein
MKLKNADERIAHHEAGHTVAALNFGLPVIATTIERGGELPHMLRGYFRRERSSAVEALAIVCLSGPAGETMVQAMMTAI